MRARIGLVAMTLLTAFLAGCSGDDPVVPPFCDDPANADSAECQPPPTLEPGKGAIRCVVVDAAIKPIAGVTVTTTVGGQPQTSVTGSNGLCTFSSLPPGTYFLQATRQGYYPSQTSVEVVAGVEPPVTKIQLVTDLSTTPYFQAYTFTGFIECSVTSPVLAYAVCDLPNDAAPNTTNDRFIAFHSLDRQPELIQHELVWESTQQTGSTFQLVSSYATLEQHNDGVIEGDLNATIGISPLVLPITKVDIDRTGVGQNGTGVVPRVFAGGAEQTVNTLCDPTNSNFGGIMVDNCLFGTGATIQQSFTIYTHVFYGYAPPEGWTFGNDGEPPSPE